MFSFTFLLISLQALLIQTAFGQVISTSGLGPEVELEALSRASAGLRGYGVGNAGINGAALNIGRSNGLAIANAAPVRAGLGSNIGASRIGLVNSQGGFAVGSNAGGQGGFAGVSDVAALASVPVGGQFVSEGNAELAVGGEFTASGQTVVAGQIPVIGGVTFTGTIPASGVVSIAGNCGCSSLPQLS